MRQPSTIKNPKTSQFNITFLQTFNKALFIKSFFITQIQKSEKYFEIDKNIYDEAEKILANLDTIYFDLDKEEKKLYKQLEKIIINYSLQK